jgi:hypothetical protein
MEYFQQKNLPSNFWEEQGYGDLTISQRISFLKKINQIRLSRGQELWNLPQTPTGVAAAKDFTMSLGGTGIILLVGIAALILAGKKL